METKESLRQYILSRAVEMAPGIRNRTGAWLAQQLRDNRFDLDEIQDTLRDYQRTVSNSGDHPYTMKEAMAAAKQAFRREPREPWGTSGSGHKKQYRPPDWLRGGEADSDAEAEARLKQILKGVMPLAESPAAEYLAARGIDPTAAGAVRYHPDVFGEPCAVFPIRNATGELVAVTARTINPEALPKSRTIGLKANGVFATPGAREADPVAIAEAPIDALTLSGAGLPAFALCGVADGACWPKWLPQALRFRTVYLAFDNDTAGRAAADRLRPALEAFGAKVRDLFPPEGVKDWNEALQRFGSVDPLKTAAQQARTAHADPSDISEDLPKTENASEKQPETDCDGIPLPPAFFEAEAAIEAAIDAGRISWAEAEEQFGRLFATTTQSGYWTAAA